MAIKLIEQQHTTRTYPRLMKHRRTGDVAMALHDDGGAIVWLNGPTVGKTALGSAVTWESFDDYVGSVTLHNSD